MINNYKGAIANKIYLAIEKNPDMSMGEILLSFLNEKSLKKHYFYATDEEIYNSLEKFTEQVSEDDEPLDEVQFNFWIQKVIVKE